MNIPEEINGKTITKIADNAFYRNKIESVNLPNTLIEIGISAFFDNQLTSIHIPNSVKTIHHNAFIDNLLTEIEIPNSVTYIGVTAFRNNQMPDDQAFIYNRNSDGTENGTSLNSYAGKNRGHVVLPATIKHIGNYAFNGNNLTAITLPASLKHIGNFAFQANDLTEIVFPANFTSLGREAFQNNIHLSHITFMGSVPTTLGNNIFKNNSRLTTNTIKVPNGTIEQYRNAHGHIDGVLYSSSQTWFGSDDTSLLDAFYE